LRLGDVLAYAIQILPGELKLLSEGMFSVEYICQALLRVTTNFGHSEVRVSFWEEEAGEQHYKMDVGLRDLSMERP